MKTIKRFQEKKSHKTGSDILAGFGEDLKHHMRQVRLDRLLSRQS